MERGAGRSLLTRSPQKKQGPAPSWAQTIRPHERQLLIRSCFTAWHSHCCLPELTKTRTSKFMYWRVYKRCESERLVKFRYSETTPIWMNYFLGTPQTSRSTSMKFFSPEIIFFFKVEVLSRYFVSFQTEKVLWDGSVCLSVRLSKWMDGCMSRL
jgi:hypothetical protein